jgi:hypothetical protein
MRNVRIGVRLIVLGLLLVSGGERGRSQNPDPGAAERYGWGFRNFADTVFSWDVYSHSFFGVPLDSDGVWLSATFDKLFYEQAFRKTLPNPDDDGVGIGNCYGISLMSLMVNKFGGYYGYCAPTSTYRGDTTWSGGKGPNDLMLHRIINVMHGRQLSLASIETYLDQAMSGHSQNCNYAAQLARQAIAKEGPCVISITPTTNPVGGGGHSLIAYGVSDDGAGHAKIWVVDPNRLWAVPSSRDRGWYQGDSNYVECNLGSGDWHFVMKGGELWPTDSHGHLIIIPLSLIGPPGRVPSSLGLAVGELLSKFFLSGGWAGGVASESTGRPAGGARR